MKTLRLKTMIIAGMASFISIGAFSNPATGQKNTSEKNFSMLKVEKAAVNKDISNIARQRDKIKSAKSDYWDATGMGEDNTSCRIDLIKARADMQKDRAYLKADKVALVNEHNIIIEQRRLVVEDTRAQLAKLHQQLNRELAKANPASLKLTQDIINCKQALSQSEVLLSQAKLNRDADLLAINKESEKLNSQPVAMKSKQKKSGQNEMIAMK